MAFFFEGWGATTFRRSRRPVCSKNSIARRRPMMRMMRTTQGSVEVRRATVEDVDLVAPLFDAYRQFYRQASDLEGARRSLKERLVLDQSVILLAFEHGAAAGFTQLYPSFSSGAMARIFVLNDLFVAPEVRGRGVGAALLGAAAEYGRREGAVRLVLSTRSEIRGRSRCTRSWGGNGTRRFRCTN
jgi:GNAT superfamily N-acetyltransferase